MTKIDTYKEIDIFYRPENGYLTFKFEGKDREVKYLFEARKIIDEPVWEECDLEGYWVDRTFHNYIGIAKSIKMDRKSGKPYWQLKGQYDIKFKDPDSWRETIVYPRNDENSKIYIEWKEKRDIVLKAESELRVIINKLK